MPRVVIVAGIEDGTKTTCHYKVTDMRILNSPETEKAMAHDGFKRDTTEIFTLDNQFTP